MTGKSAAFFVVAVVGTALSVVSLAEADKKTEKKDKQKIVIKLRETKKEALDTLPKANFGYITNLDSMKPNTRWSFKATEKNATALYLPKQTSGKAVYKNMDYQGIHTGGSQEAPVYYYVYTETSPPEDQ